MQWLAVRSCLDLPDRIDVAGERENAARRPQIAVDIIAAWVLLGSSKEKERECLEDCGA